MENNLTIVITIIGIVAVLFLSYFIIKKVTENNKKNAKKLKENMCTCSGTMSLNKKIIQRDLSNPAGYQFKRQEGGYDFIAV